MSVSTVASDSDGVNGEDEDITFALRRLDIISQVATMMCSGAEELVVPAA